MDDSTSHVIRAANLALKFVLELCAFAAFAYAGAAVGSGALAVLAAVLAPAIAVALWAVFAAPKSHRRLPTTSRVPFELTVFALAAAALLAVGVSTAAAIFTAAAVINAALLTAFQQWEA